MAALEFWGWNEQELLSALRAAQDDLARGKSILSTGAGDINAASQIQITARERINAIGQALYQIDPDTYADFQLSGQNRTTLRFNSSTRQY